MNRSANLSIYSGLKKWGWYLDDLERWGRLFATDQPARVLEIGAFDGVSANVMLDVLFSHSDSSVHCVDAFLPDPTTPQVNETTRRLFEENMVAGGHEAQIRLHVGLSLEVLARMITLSDFRSNFDFIYVDGSHLARNVLIDATQSWGLLKVGGIIVFDDYTWGARNDPYGRPKIAIDAFVKVFADRLFPVLDGGRKGYKKLSE